VNKMNVLLSVKPKYAELIMKGLKKYEFRKVVFKNKYTKYAYVYSSSPVQKIVGTFQIGSIIEDRPSILWDQLKGYSGMEEDEFFDYFGNREKGFAIEIKDVKRFEDPLDPKELMPRFVPPLSFCYISELNEVPH
jgi:predicted transcriptional regulator